MNIEEKNMSTFIKQIEESINEKSIKNKSFKPIEAFSIFKNECVYLVDFSQNKIIYKKGFKNVLGFQEDEITLDFLFNNIHPDDTDIVHRIIRATIIYCLEHPNNSANNVLSIRYRRKRKDGTYINILSHSTIYELDEKGRLSKGLAKLTDVSFMDTAKNINWNFKADNLNEIAFKQQVYKAYKNFFTDREIEIIIEINKGLTNKLIGKKLYISEYTVAAHRKNILKKSHCHSQNELILFCKGRGII